MIYQSKVSKRALRLQVALSAMTSVGGASLGLRFRHLSLTARPTPAPLLLPGLHRRSLSSPLPVEIRCGLRGGPKQPLWRGKVMSTEAIQAVHALKLAKSSPIHVSSSSLKMDEVLDGRIGRLLKADQLAVLAELQRQNEWELALQVFYFIRKEVWCKSEVSLYSTMILMLGKNKLIDLAEELFSQLKKEGLQPDTRAYTEMIGVFLQAGMVEKAMDMYRAMKEDGCIPDKLTLTILIRNLDKFGEEKLASEIREECAKYMDFPEKFLQEVDKKYPKRRSLDLV